MKNNVISNMKLKFEDQVNTPKSKLNRDSSLHDLAQEFESLFVFKMLKVLNHILSVSFFTLNLFYLRDEYHLKDLPIF